MWRLRTLASQMLLGIVGVLIVTTAVGAVLYGRLARQTLDSQYEERARTAADMVAALAEVRQAVAAGDPQNQLQPLARHLGERAGLTYIVITDRNGLRFRTRTRGWSGSASRSPSPPSTGATTWA